MSLFTKLVMGGGIAAGLWLIEIVRGWRIDLAIRRGEDLDNV